MPLPDLDILVAIADTGTLTAAAERLDLPRPTLSRRLVRLEEQMGARLVHRTTRRLTLTETGQQLYRHARPIVDAIEVASNAVRARDGVPRGLLRVSISRIDTSISEMFVAFARRYPEVQLELVSDARFVDLVAEGFDVAIRAGHLAGPSLLSRRLAMTDTLPVASPAYLAERGVPTTLEALAEHSALVGFARGEVPNRTWPLRDGGRTPVHPRFASNDIDMRMCAALGGLGVTLLPDLLVSASIEAGLLVPVMPEVVGARTGVWLVYPEKRLMLPRVRALIDHVAAWLEDHPLIARTSGSPS